MLLSGVETIILAYLSLRQKYSDIFIQYQHHILPYRPFSCIIQCGSELPAVKLCFCNFNAFRNLTTSGFMKGFQIVRSEPLPSLIGNVALKSILILAPNQHTFFFEKCFKKILNIFSNSFYLKVQSFRLIMEKNFIQMASSAGQAVAYTIGPIFKHIIDFVQLYFTNGFTNIIL